MSYEDFVFRLEANGYGWTARVLESPAGEGSGPFALAIDPEDCLRIWVSQADTVRGGRKLAACASPSASPAFSQVIPADLSHVAGALFRALFPEEVRRLWERSLGLVAPGWLRIQLRMDPREPGIAPLLALPWELIQDPETRRHWGLSRETPLLRYVEMAEPRDRSFELPRPLRILVVASQPTDTPPLELEREQRLIRKALADEEGVEVGSLAEARLGALREAILDGGCHVLHFMGHGDFRAKSGEGCLLFETAERRSDRVSAEALATKLGDLRSLRLVVLNACHGGAIRSGEGRDPFAGVASALVRRGLPAVVAMQLPISDAAAIAFSRTFYRRLAAGDPIEVAVVEGRQAIHSEERRSLEWAVPALFSRLHDGRLFDLSSVKPPLSLPGGQGETQARPDANAQQPARPPATVEEAEDRTRRILAAAVAGSLPDDMLATTCGELLAGEHEVQVERVLVESLREPSAPATARAAAKAVTLVERWTPDVAEALAAARPLDAAPWPIEAALRGVAAYDSDLLPHSRSSLRRTLRRRRDLAQRFLGNGDWRRLGLFVYGGLGDTGEVTFERFHYDRPPRSPQENDESPELSREILTALEHDRPATSLVPMLRRLVRDGATELRRDAALALAALGKPLDRLLTTGELRPALERLRASLKTASVTARTFGVALARHLESLEPARRDEILHSILALVPRRSAEPAALLEVAESLPPEQRTPWLIELWRRLLSASRPRSVYNLAVVLDTAGAVLSDPPWLLARSLARAVIGQAAACARTPRDELFVALDAIASLPRALDFVRGWALVRLKPLLDGAGLLPEALVLALALSDRLEARADTVRRLLAEDDPRRTWLEHPRPALVLLEMAQGIADPLVRFRAFRRLTESWLSTRIPLLVDRLDTDQVLLAPASSAVLEISDRIERTWAREELKRLSGGHDPGGNDQNRAPSERGQLLLAARVDEAANPVSVLVALALVEDLLPQTDDKSSQESQGGSRPTPGMGNPVSRLGLKAVHRLARAWLDRREAEPGAAVVLRWELEAVEHDDAEALAEWAGMLRDGERREAEEAEAILGNIHAVRGHVWLTVREMLEGGCPRARRALLRSVGFLLARRRLPSGVWQDMVPALRLLADDGDLAKKGFVLDGPAAVVSAGGAVRQVLADGTAGNDSVVEVAERAYERYRRPWPEALREPSDALRKMLASVGAERLVTARSRAEVAAAADRLAGEPPVFEVLLEWASRHMRRDVQHDGPEDYLVGDLLCVLAGAAERLPEVYARKTRALPLWERQLCEAVRFCDWYPARQAALVLLGCGRKATPRTVVAFRQALHEVPEVAQTALLGLTRFQEIEPSSLPKHLAEHYYRWLYETKGLDGILPRGRQ